MAYRFLDGESVEPAIQRIAKEQIGKALGELDDDQLPRPKTIHQVRKRCKKVRGLLRLVRPALGDTYAVENKHFRDAARRLSEARDATALIETYDALMDRFADTVDRRAFAPIRGALTRQRADLVEDRLDLDERLTAFRADLLTAQERLATWSLDAEEFDAVDGGLQKTYGRGCDAMAQVSDDPTDEHLHEWRKRIKYHRYHIRLLRPIWYPVMQARRKALKHLSDLLGDDHDLAVFRQTLRAAPERFDNIRSLSAFLGLLDQRRAELQTEAWILARRVFAEPPAALSRRLRAYWEAWRREDAPIRTASEDLLVPAGL